MKLRRRDIQYGRQPSLPPSLDVHTSVGPACLATKRKARERLEATAWRGPFLYYIGVLLRPGEW